MSTLATAIHDTRIGTDDCATTMHEALQRRFDFPIELTELTYLPPADSVRVQIRPSTDDAETERALNQGDDDLQLGGINGSLTFTFV